MPFSGRDENVALMHQLNVLCSTEPTLLLELFLFLKENLNIILCTRIGFCLLGHASSVQQHEPCIPLFYILKIQFCPKFSF